MSGPAIERALRVGPPWVHEHLPMIAGLAQSVELNGARCASLRADVALRLARDLGDARQELGKAEADGDVARIETHADAVDAADAALVDLLGYLCGDRVQPPFQP